MGSSRAEVDASWLIRILSECGLGSEDAARCAAAVIRRFSARRPDPRPVGAQDDSIRGRRLRIRQALVKSPWISLVRMVGVSAEEVLPLVDVETRQLSEPSLAQTFEEGGLDPVVALAYAKVVAFGYTPYDLYRPVWLGLGQRGVVDFEVLARLDWSALFPGPPEAEPTVTKVQAVMPKPPTKVIRPRLGDKKGKD